MTKELQLFLDEHYDGLVLAPGLFYSWKNSIRFAISPPFQADEKQKFKQIFERSITVFNKVFEDNDPLLLVTDVHSIRGDNSLQRKPLNVDLKYTKHKKHYTDCNIIFFQVFLKMGMKMKEMTN